jgi:hypothetical protein
MIVRPITPAGTPPHILNVKTLATTTTVPCGISQDQSTVYGCSGDVLYYSTNDGSTWTTAHTFSGPSGLSVLGIQETDDGEALVTTTASFINAYVFKSSGWAASKTGATWTQVLESQTNTYIRPCWGFSSSAFGSNARVAGSGAIGVCTEYGGQSSVNNPWASRLYLTTNYGATWTTALDYATTPGSTYSATPDHCLGCAYDPWWDRLISLHQTHTPTTQMYMLYSDDHGATWNTINMPAWFNVAVSGGIYGSQNTTISVLEDCWVLQSAHIGPGVVRMPKLGFRQIGNPYTVALIAPHTGNQSIGYSSYRHRGLYNAPLLMGNIVQDATIPAMLIASLDDGQSFQEIWRDDQLKVGAAGDGPIASPSGACIQVFGPTQLGNYVGYVGQENTVLESGGTMLIVGEIIEGRLGDYKQYLDCTGNGSATEFTFPHYLNKTPDHVTLVPQSYTAVNSTAPVVTQDGTNIYLTFGAAPANAAVLEFAAVYG